MLPQYDMEQMIANIKRRCAVPTSQLTYTDSDFTKLCTDELQTMAVPLIMSCREEFFVTTRDIATPADRRIPFPSDTVSSKIRALTYLQQSSPVVTINIPRIDIDIVNGVGFSNYATLAGFYLENNEMVLYPNTSVPVGTMLRMFLYRRTLDIAAPADYGRVLAINTGSNTVTLDFLPPAWEIGDVVNSVNSIMPFDVTNAAMTITNVSSPSLIVDNVDDLQVGDYISLQGYSAIPQIPIEAHAYLAQLTAVQCLEGLGDQTGKQSAEEKAEKLKTNLLILISQRVDGSIKKIMNASGGLRLGAGIGRWGGGWSGGRY